MRSETYKQTIPWPPLNLQQHCHLRSSNRYFRIPIPGTPRNSKRSRSLSKNLHESYPQLKVPKKNRNARDPGTVCKDKVQWVSKGTAARAAALVVTPPNPHRPRPLTPLRQDSWNPLRNRRTRIEDEYPPSLPRVEEGVSYSRSCWSCCLGRFPGEIDVIVSIARWRNNSLSIA